MLVLGCYTYDGWEQVWENFHRMLVRSGSKFTFHLVHKLPEGEYGITHVEEYIRLLEEDSDSETVLLTDVRDVIVQGPVDALPSKNLTFYLEDMGRTIGGCEFNTQWIHYYYGPKVLWLLANRPICNAGIVTGPKADVLYYLKKLADEMRKLTQPKAGVDMAAHNKLLYVDGIEADVYDNKGPVYTVGHTNKICVSRHRILNEAGEIPILVHQFDRHLEGL